MPKNLKIKKVLVIGSGPIIIGQGAEFDYSGSQCCLALQEENIEIILLNNNPATIMTDVRKNQKVYSEAITIESINKIIQIEKPDSLIVNMGGQTALNIALEMQEKGLITKCDLQVLGTPMEKIKQGEDRKLFRQLMKELNEPVVESEIINSINQLDHFIIHAQYPVIVRPAYTLGGRGGGIANSKEELTSLVNEGIASSPINQVICEKSLLGYKEVEIEMIRDASGTSVCVCDMENFDPVGVHTGDSIVFAPCQTISSHLLSKLKKASVKIVDALQIIGGCNIQFAVHPESEEYYLIEVNPRVSRSSALASKATGYPIAKIATLLALGYTLLELDSVHNKPYKAAIAPKINYVVGKLPVWPFDKLGMSDTTLDTKMKATGEIMVIDHSIEALFGKMISSQVKSFSLGTLPTEQLLMNLTKPSHKRLFEIIELFKRGITVGQINHLTQIHPMFLTKIKKLAIVIKHLESGIWTNNDLILAKCYQLDNYCIASFTKENVAVIEERLNSLPIKKGFQYVKSVNNDSIHINNYLYSTYLEKNEIHPSNASKKIAIIGSSAIQIGQGVEFDYCTVKAIQRLKQLGYYTVIINDNPETVSNDYEIADRLYFEPVTVDSVTDILKFEGITDCLVQFGGQTALNIGLELEKKGFHLVGLNGESIKRFEDREYFYSFLDELNIQHPKGFIANTKQELEKLMGNLQFPIITRPSYVIGGVGMQVLSIKKELQNWMNGLDERNFPILIDRFISGKEVEVDVISDGVDVYFPGIIEHVERAGVHSGDSISIFPAVSISKIVEQKIYDICKLIIGKSKWIGTMNIQFIIHEEDVYCIEVNPRASRTIPIISKILNVSLIDMVIDILLENKKLKNMAVEPIKRFGLKIPYFSYHSLTELNQSLTPNMKSTGEGLVIGSTFEEACRKLSTIVENKEIIYLPSTDSFKERREGVLQGKYVITNEETKELFSRIEKNGEIPIEILNGESILI